MKSYKNKLSRNELRKLGRELINETVETYSKIPFSYLGENTTGANCLYNNSVNGVGCAIGRILAMPDDAKKN